MAAAVADNPRWIWIIGPFFAALAGIGFKEFFCFRRPEAIGVTLLLPVALLGCLSGLLPAAATGSLMGLEAALLLVLWRRYDELHRFSLSIPQVLLAAGVGAGNGRVRRLQ